MSSKLDDETTNFRVVVNHEEQYSILPMLQALPAGWRAVGKSGKKLECLAYIEKMRTDRPITPRGKSDKIP